MELQRRKTVLENDLQKSLKGPFNVSGNVSFADQQSDSASALHKNMMKRQERKIQRETKRLTQKINFVSSIQPMFLLNQVLLRIYIELQIKAGINEILDKNAKLNLIDKRKNEIVPFDQLKSDQTYLIEPQISDKDITGNLANPILNIPLMEISEMEFEESSSSYNKSSGFKMTAKNPLLQSTK